jgi:hypothetical protein
MYLRLPCVRCPSASACGASRNLLTFQLPGTTQFVTFQGKNSHLRLGLPDESSEGEVSSHADGRHPQLPKLEAFERI